MAAQKVLEQLTASKVKYRVIKHSDYGVVNTAADFARLSGIPIESIAKSLLLKSKDEFFMAVLPVAHKMDLSKIADLLSIQNIDVASLDMLSRVTGYERHGTTSLGLDIKTIVDSSLIAWEKIYVASGIVGEELEIDPKDLAALVKAVVDDISLES